MNGNTERSLPPIPGYEIRGRIGAGGGGTVYRAWHCNLRKDVVIKRIHDKITDEEQQRTEADILKNLHHPYLPQVFDYFVIDGVAYTVMDFIEGESLQRMLNRGVRFSEKQVLKYARQLTEAVDYLHSRHVPIIHGDIKPDNIMCTPEDNICLIDVNISGISTDGNAYTFGYSPGFSAPEQHDAFVRIRREMHRDGSYVTLNGATEELTASRPAPSQYRTTDVLTDSLQQGGRFTEDGTEILPGSQYAGNDGYVPTENLSAGNDGYVPTENLSAGAQYAGNDAYVPTENLSAGSGDYIPTENLSAGNDAYVPTENLSAAPQYAEDGTEILPGSPYTGKAGYVPTEPLQEAYKPRAAAPEDDGYGTRKIRLNSGIPINKRSDVYSCGATLYYLYTGKAFDPDQDNLLRSGTSEGFIYVLNRALQRDPARRFADGGQMRRALDKLHKNNSSYRRLMVGQALVKILLVVVILIGVGLIISGRDHWKKEMEQEYTTYIVDLNEYRREDKEEKFKETFDAAIGLFPERIDAWYQKALYLYEQGKYEATVDFIEKEIPMDEAIYQSEDEETGREKDIVTIANLYSVLGNAYFELGDYKKSENSMATAIYYDDRNAEFYVTRAIALARLSETDKAEGLLDKAIALKVSDDNLNLARGEIAYARGKYEEAEQLLRQCVDETTDDYRLLRAAIRCAESVNQQKPGQGEADSEAWREGLSEEDKQKIREMTDRSASVLNEALNRLPKQYHLMLLHQLSFQYSDAYNMLGEEEYGNKALDVLEEIDRRGYAGIESYVTMLSLYYQLERYDDERALLERLDQEYPDHYIVPLYYAMMTAAMETKKDYEEQDFSGFLEYYNEAERRIALLDEARRGDTDIQWLEDTYRDLVDKGRL